MRERLDGVVPGEWDLTLELLPTLAVDAADDATCSFKARLQILGVIREDVGTGRDYKQAATDAFKRAAVRFGIAHELYAYEQNWVPVDSDGKYARPLEDPADVYARRASRTSERLADRAAADEPSRDSSESESVDDVKAGGALDVVSGTVAIDEPTCPKCGGRMWDNRISKRNPKAPDFKCRSRACDGVLWPPRANAGSPESTTFESPDATSARTERVSALDELPF